MKLMRTMIALMLVFALLLTGCSLPFGGKNDDTQAADESISNMQGLLQQRGEDEEIETEFEVEDPVIEDPIIEDPADVDLGSYSSGAIYEGSYFVCDYQDFADPLAIVMAEFGYSLEFEGIYDGDAEYYLYDSNGNDTGIWMWMPLESGSDKMEEVYMVMPEDSDDTTTGVYGIMVIAACSMCDPNFDWEAFTAEAEAAEPNYEDGGEYVLFSMNDVYYMVASLDGDMCINIY